MENPLNHFELLPILAAVFLFFLTAVRTRQLVPTKIQSMAEMSLELLRGMVLENMGEEGMRFFPFIVTLFFFILFANLLGLIPGTYTITSQVMVTGLFALIAYAISIFVGFKIHGLHFLKILVPPGTPKMLLPFMVVLELFSQSIRPITLAVRLFANMTAGHTILIVLFSMMLAGGVLIGWLPFIFTVPVYLLEVFVAFIQAFIFTILATVYIGEAIKLH